MSQEVSRNSSRITSPFRISLLFWVWTSCLKKIDLLSQEPERLRSSSHNHSQWLKYSLVCQEDSQNLLIPLKVSHNSLMELVMTIQRPHSIWSVDSRKPSRREERSKQVFETTIRFRKQKINDRTINLTSANCVNMHGIL